MNTKRKKTGRRVLSFLLTLAMVVGLLPGMSLTSYAETIRSTEIRVGNILAKGVVIFFARIVNGNGENGDKEFYHPFKLKVYMDGSLVKSIETGVSTPQEYNKQDRLYTVPKNCIVVSYSDNLQNYAHDHTLYLKSLEKPTARNNLTYTGKPQELVTPPVKDPEGYEVRYSLDGTNWSTEIPKGTDVGNYTVKVKYVGDGNHTTFDGEDIPVTIALELTDAQKPKAKDNLTYTGKLQELVTAPTAALPEPYKIVYALGDANGPTEEYTTSIPAKTDAGTYYVWYKVIADANHNDSEPVCIKVVIQSAAYAVLKVDNADHTIGSGQNAVITVKRSAGDDRTFSLYTGAAMDGTPIASGNCDTAPGSLILTLKSFYLDSLSVGDHKLTISFQDGSVDTTVKILPAASVPTPTPKPVPKTGDSANPALWLAMMLVALIGFAGLAVTGTMKASRKKK